MTLSKCSSFTLFPVSYFIPATSKATHIQAFHSDYLVSFSDAFYISHLQRSYCFLSSQPQPVGCDALWFLWHSWVCLHTKVLHWLSSIFLTLMLIETKDYLFQSSVLQFYPWAIPKLLGRCYVLLIYTYLFLPTISCMSWVLIPVLYTILSLTISKNQFQRKKLIVINICFLTYHYMPSTRLHEWQFKDAISSLSESAETFLNINVKYWFFATRPTFLFG